MGSSISSCFFGCFGGFSFSPASSASPPAPSLPLPPPSPPQIKYDVFLSFRGEDTRYNFVTHIHKALDERGIDTFIDYNLNRGDEISPALLTAIEESRISIIIFSKEYASSTWCLQELMKILECKDRETNKQIVIPVFYGVTPSDLENIRTGSFADAFAKHEKHFKKNLEQVHRWKDALKEAADLAGWPSSSDKSEAEFIEDIVEDVWQKLYYLSSSDTDKLVGVDSKIKEIESLLCMGTNNVCSVGIWGIGGIGKTTLAEAVFNKISCQFKGCSYFAKGVRARCEQSDGLNRLQQELLSAVLGDNRANINVFATGNTFIKNRLGHKKVLIVFDDVSDVKQIEKLIGHSDCLGPQSRVIITTRDKQVLENWDVNQVYTVQGLTDHEALALFHMHAFRRNDCTKDYRKLSKRVVKYAGGIPLALKVLGSYLYKSNIEDWESAIEKLSGQPDNDIYKVLKISYDGLDYKVQQIFLDIACVFGMSSIEEVKSVLNECGFHTGIGIKILLDKSLIAISHDIITMHDLLREMAKEIVRRESPKNPEMRSRLWNHEEIYNILTKNRATAKIETIALDMSKIEDDISLNPCDFKEMYNLRVIKFYNSSYRGMNRVHVAEGLQYDFDAVRYLSWHKCPLKSPLSSFSLKNIVKLQMRKSKIEQLWNGVLLKEVDVSESYLTSCPDFSGSPNIEILRMCKTKVKQLWNGVLPLAKLKEVDVSESCLTSCPDFSGSPNIEILRMRKTKVKQLWNGVLPLAKLKEVDVSESCLTSCPDFSGSPNIEILRMRKTKVKQLWNGVLPLAKLKEVDVSESCLTSCPDFSGSPNIEILGMYETKVKQLWNGVLRLPKLKNVDLSQTNLTSCPDFSGSPNLKILNLSGCRYLCEISPSIGCLDELVVLDIGYTGLRAIPDLSRLESLRDLCVSGCYDLKMLPELPCNLKLLLSTSTPIDELPLSFGNLSRIRTLIIEKCQKLKRLPSRIGELKSLQVLSLNDCSELDELPEEIGHLSSLKILSAERTPIRQLPSSMIFLKKLKRLSFSGLKVHDTLQSWRDSSDGDDNIGYAYDGDLPDAYSADYDGLPDDCFSTITTKLRLDLSKCMMVKCLQKPPLGGRCADNLTAIEVLSSFSFQDCTPLSDFEDIAKNTVDTLQKIKTADVLLSYPGSEVPKWFDFRESGHSIKLGLLGLPPNWLSQSFKGFALCFVVSPRQVHEKDCNTIYIFWTCEVIMKDGQSFVRSGRGVTVWVNHVYVKCPTLPFSPHILCDAKQISFEIKIPRPNERQNFKIEKCGLHLMYAQYIEEVGGSSQVGEDENIVFGECPPYP